MNMMLSENQVYETARSLTSPPKLRILFLAPFAPDLKAAHGGARVIAQLISHLEKRYTVGLCYLRSANEPTVDTTLKKRCDVIEEVILPDHNVSGLKCWLHRLRVWKELLAGKPLWAIDRFSPVYGERLRKLVETWKPDVVQIEFHVMGQYLSAFEDYPVRRILVDHEPGVESARETIGSPFAKGRLMPFLDLLAWKRFEPKVVRQVDTVVVFTDRDRTAVRNLRQKTALVQISLGTEIPRRATKEVWQDAFNLLFVGNFIHAPNVDAADRLINSIFPKIQSQVPGAHLFIVGDRLPSTVQRDANPSITITGYVPDVTPYLEQASLIVLPIRLGGGMRVKTLEALAAGKAVIASSRAVEGLDVTDGKQLILAETDEDFVRAVVDLLRNPEKRLALATQARSWASANLSWGSTAAEYEKLYRCLLKC